MKLLVSVMLSGVLLGGAGTAHADLPDFTQLVEKNAPAVVNVQATHSGKIDNEAADGGDDQDMPDVLRRFFGPQGPQGPQGQGRPRGGPGEGTSIGSGFIISADGYVLTNNHVVEGADQVTVRLSDRRELDAKVVGTDPQTDIALLKVEASSLPVVAIGDSTKLKQGQWVVAIGSPFNFDHTVTHGIISSVQRKFGGADQQYVGFIQTDVPINRGNSGGPLFNLNGEVIGINSQILSNTGGYMGVSFSIPIDVAMNDVEQIKSKGHVSRGMIGVQIQDINREMAQSLGLPRPGGALVNKITPASAAEKAGIHVGDVILSFNGKDLDHSSDLPPLVGMSKPGSQVEVKLFRDGKTLSVPVTVGELPQDKNALAAAATATPTASNPLGIVVEDLTAEQRKELGLKDQGVVISNITGAARRTQLQQGDVILMVGKTSVKSASELNLALKGLKPGDTAMLLVRREDATSFVAVTVPKAREKS